MCEEVNTHCRKLVPLGTYQGTGMQVIVKEKEGIIETYSLNEELIYSHLLSYLKIFKKK